MRKVNNILLGIIIGVFSTAIIILLPGALPKHWFQNLMEFLTAVGTVGAVGFSLWLARDSKKVKFNPEVKIEMGEPNSAAIEYIRYQIYGYNSGNIGDAIVKVNFFAESKGKKVKFFSKEQMINVKPVNFLDSGVLCEKVTTDNISFTVGANKIFVQYVIRNYDSVYFELITHSGKIYNGDAKLLINSFPKYAVRSEPSYGDIYQVSALDGNNILSRDHLRSEAAKSKFMLNQVMSDVHKVEVYSWLPDKETAEKVLNQYIKELKDEF